MRKVSKLVGKGRNSPKRRSSTKKRSLVNVEMGGGSCEEKWEGKKQTYFYYKRIKNIVKKTVEQGE